MKALSPLNPPMTDESIRSTTLKFVWKISGAVKPSKANGGAVERAKEEVAEAAPARLAARLI